MGLEEMREKGIERALVSEQPGRVCFHRCLWFQASVEPERKRTCRENINGVHMLGLLGQPPLGPKTAKPYTEQQAAVTPTPMHWAGRTADVRKAWWCYWLWEGFPGGWGG